MSKHLEVEKAIKDFRQAFIKLNELTDSRDMDYMSNNYPFAYSFDELTLSVIDWCDEMLSVLNESLKGRKFNVAASIYENTGGNCMVQEINVVYEDYEHVYIGVNEECVVVYEHQHLCASEEDYEKYCDEDAIESYDLDAEEPMNSRFYGAMLIAIKYWLFHSGAEIQDPDASSWQQWRTAGY